MNLLEKITINLIEDEFSEEINEFKQEAITVVNNFIENIKSQIKLWESEPSNDKMVKALKDEIKEFELFRYKIKNNFYELDTNIFGAYVYFGNQRITINTKYNQLIDEITDYLINGDK